MLFEKEQYGCQCMIKMEGDTIQLSVKYDDSPIDISLLTTATGHTISTLNASIIEGLARVDKEEALSWINAMEECLNLSKKELL